MKQIIPELYVHNCKEALEVYQGLFGGEIRNLQMSDDLELFAGVPDKVIHSELHVNGRCVLYFVDIFEERRNRPGNVTVVLHLESEEAIRRAFDTLSQGGQVGMALQKTYWNAWHAIVTDRFGAPWALSCPG